MIMNNQHTYLLFLFILLFSKPAETNITEHAVIFKLTDKNNSSEENIKNRKLNTTVLRVLSNKIHDYYSKLFKQKRFNGCVLIAIEDKIIYENAFGYSDALQKTCLNTGSLFQLASVSKIFTSIAILRLHEKKILDINNCVQKYLPEFPYAGVTIKQLLNHTSGLPNYLHIMPGIGRQDTVLSHQSVVQFLINKKYHSEFKPGRKYKYCNTNYAILACIIERVSGMNYSDFLKKEIFTPCKMLNTNTIYYIDVFDENTTISSEYKSRVVPFYAGDFILGDKSIYSNIHDLFRFSQCFLAGQILNDSTMNLMTCGVKTNKYGMIYGCGIRIKDYQDSSKTVWFHNGWWHGYRTSFQMRPKDKVIVIVLSNHIHKTTYFTYPVFEYIDEVLYQKNTNDEPLQVYPLIDEE